MMKMGAGAAGRRTDQSHFFSMTPGGELIPIFGTSENAGSIWHLVVGVDGCILQTCAITKLGGAGDRFGDY